MEYTFTVMELEALLSEFAGSVEVHFSDSYLQLWDRKANQHVAYIYQDGTVTTEQDERGEGVHIEGKLPR